MVVTEVPRVIGHRGAAGHAPENTLVSIQKAFDLGARWVEVDVKLSSDGVPILMHDDRLERTTNGSGLAAEASLAELERLDAGRWFGAEFAGAHIPTLAELVGLLAELGMGLNLELKPSPRQEDETGRVVAEVFSDLWGPGLPAPVISSFTPASLSAFADVAPEFERAMLFGRLPSDWHAQVQTVGAQAVHCGVKYIKRHDVADINAVGLPVRCYTVNDGETAGRLFHWGVEAVFSDYPECVP
ncbi:MAG: glycerophosphoryl diester phosphodiesterase [Rhodospirillaceae bacterium]|jgi:glycerophosphoryl diester phosphodiesterase|nr:glycerophosphoryl diester phosphodiesterase [Rhodospirillaceae bacterium]